MKHSLLLLLFCFLCKAAVYAVPAYPKGHRVMQPDGSFVTLYAHGDERGHYLTTADGEVVCKGADGFYRATGEDATTAWRKAAARKPALAPIKGPNKSVFHEKFRGLVLLVSFNDRDFSMSDEKTYDYFSTIMNKRNLTSYNPGKYLTTYMKLTGSVRDYFYDNSNGVFDPEFDVVGPLKMDVSQYYIDGYRKTAELTEKVLQRADEEGLDFTKYDADEDGVIDMLYVIYAGYSSNYQDNDERLVWPHANTMEESITGRPTPVFDGKKVGRYACSAEIFGWHDDGDKMLDGIGVIVHEFSHVLGLQDHYDTSNGYQEHPNAWDVMSAGNYSEDLNRTPCGFNSFEKHAAGFSEPVDITDMAGQHITLGSAETTHQACLIRSYQHHVSYFMENRQPDKWDRNLPGKGLLVWRVDSIRPEYWTQNYINVTTRACFRLVRACGTQGSFLTGVVDTDYDSFPGTHNITELDNDDDAANLISYDGYPCPVVMRNIRQQEGQIGFDVEYDALAKNSPITYAIPERLKATAEQLVGEDWVPVSWVLTTTTDGEAHQLHNFLPGSEQYNLAFSYLEDGSHTVTINSQRMEKGSDYSKWFCNFTNVDEQGAGVLTMTVDRYGIPLVNPETQVGYCTMKPTSYVVNAKNILSRDAIYRNLVFSECSTTDIEALQVGTQVANKAVKMLQDGRVVIKRNGKTYNMNGQLLGN